MSTTTQPPKPKRRWYQFSLLTLLVVMTVFAVTVGWVGSKMLQARKNRERVAEVEDAVVALEKLGGRVTSEYEGLRPQTWLEEQFDDPGGADDPVGILDVMKVDFALTETTDTGLEHLKGLTNLRELYLTGTQVTDVGLQRVKELTNLQTLLLDGTKVSDAGLKQLKGLTKLRRLGLSHTTVTDAGLDHLKLTGLQFRSLWSNNITDAGLEHLKGLDNLRELYLNNTKVTDEGVKKLQQALPNCEIHR